MPKPNGRRLVHVEGFFDEFLLAKIARKIHHPHIEKMVAVAEIAKVDEIAVVTHKDGIRELEVAVDGGVLVGDSWQ